jgi:signal-transduction protein with cAMP-binding, CBS, and nucleotidyltransferase domain
MPTAEDILNDKNRTLIIIDHRQTLFDAVETMVAQRIGAILVSQEKAIVGIWTERDLLNQVSTPDFDLRTTMIGDVMTHPVRHVAHDATLEHLQDMFLGLYIRHILVKKFEKDIGLISIGDVTRAGLMDKDRQIKELHKIASWEYYENWGWHRPSAKR